MKANSKRTQARLARIQIHAIPIVDQALQEGRISIESAEVISRYSLKIGPEHVGLDLQELLLSLNVPARPKLPEKKVVVMPGLAEKQAQNEAAHERIAEAMRFQVT